jgi:hypothetical protein
MEMGRHTVIHLDRRQTSRPLDVMAAFHQRPLQDPHHPLLKDRHHLWVGIARYRGEIDLRDQFVAEVLAQHRKRLLGRCQHRFNEPQRIERQQRFTAEAVGARFANGLRKRIDDAKRNAARG